MKLRELNESTLLYEVRVMCATQLDESIMDYINNTVLLLRNKKPEELFDPKNPLINIPVLTELIAGLKILANKDYRSAITHDDIGVDPRDAKDLYHLFDMVPKTGDLEDGKFKQVKKTFHALCVMSPKIVREVGEKLKNLEKGDEQQFKEALAWLQKLQSMTQQMFGKLKNLAHGNGNQQQDAAVATMGAVKAA